MKMKQTEYSEKSAYKIQMLGNYPDESTQLSEHGESLKSRKGEYISLHVYLHKYLHKMKKNILYMCIIVYMEH